MEQNHRGIEKAREVWRRRRNLGFLVSALVLAAAAGIVFGMPDLYEATAKVLIERDTVSDTLVRSSREDERLDVRLQTISQQILSRRRLLSVIEQHDLYPDQRGILAPEALAERMREDIGIELLAADPGRSGTTIAFELSYRAADPGKAAEVTNTLAQYYVDEHVAARERQVEGTSRLLEGQIEQLERNLSAQESKIREYKARHMGGLPSQVSANLAAIERLNMQLRLNQERQRTLGDRMADRERYESLMRGAVGPVGLDGGDELARMKSELARLRARFSDDYPDVRELKSAIARVERERAAGDGESADAGAPDAVPLPGMTPEEIRNEIENLRAEEADLQRRIAGYTTRVESTPGVEQQLDELTRDYESTRDLYHSLLEKQEQANLTGKMDQQNLGEQFRILEPAVAPRAPAAPARLQLLLFGVAGSLLVGLGAVVVAEHLDTTFHSRDELREFTSVPILATIPTIDGRGAGQVFKSFATAMTVLAAIGAVAAACYVYASGSEQLVQLVSRGGS